MNPKSNKNHPANSSTLGSQESNIAPQTVQSSENGLLTRRRRILATAGVTIGMFLSAIDSTAVTTAMPTVVSQLGGLNIYSWVFAAYILTSTITLPFWGRLSDFYGRRVFYVIGTAIFLLGSILSGQSSTMFELISFRAIQGLGAGALITLGTTIIGEIYSLKERAKIQGLFGGVWGLSSILGPIVGGMITDAYSWRWIFYLNLPFGIIAATIIAYALNKRQKAYDSISVDYSGAIVFILFILGVVFGLESISSLRQLSSPTAALYIAACTGLLYLFIKIERKASHPMLPLELFKNSYFKSSAAVSFLIGMAMFGSISFIPLFIQGVLGTTAAGTGRVIMPLLLSWVSISGISGRLMLRFGYKKLVVLGTSVLTLGFFLLTGMTPDTSTTQAFTNMIFVGIGMGLIFMPTLLAVQSAVSKSNLGIATSSTQFFRSIGGVVGVTLMGSVMSLYLENGSKDEKLFSGFIENGNSFNPDLIVNPLSRATLPPHIVEAMSSLLSNALHHVFITGLIVAILSFFASLLVPSGDSYQNKKTT